MKFYGIITTLAVLTVVRAAPTPPKDLDHYMNIAVDTYDLYWSVIDKEIIFEVQVKTLGYVGFGISKTGGMNGADIVTAWVKDDLVYFQDRYSNRNAQPPVDEEQNWSLIEGRESDGYTIIRFKRPLISCDREYDIDITGETVRLIYAFHPTDPEDAGSIAYHGSDRRGTKSTTLLLHGVQKNLDVKPEFTGYVDLLQPNFTIPAKPTTYQCHSFKMPKLADKHQIVRIEPIIQPGHEGIVHHILLYACLHDFDEDAHENINAECYQDLMGEVEKCTAVLAAWAIGGLAFNYPDHAGYPIGDGKFPTMIRMETHYDNPAPSKSGIADSSGLRLYYTDKLRDYDSGILEVGALSDKSLVVPPKYDNMAARFFCTSECLSKAIPQTEDLKIFGVLLHAHLLGTHIKLRHFRDGKELAPIAKDDFYDFNYQDFRILPEEVSVKPGDLLVTECDYNSAKIKNVTLGGLGTTNEMCLAYLMHYPKRAFSRCLSAAVPSHIVQFIDPTIVADETDIYTRKYNFNITGPAEFANKNLEQVLDVIDWDNSTWRKRFQDNMMKSGQPIAQVCNDGYWSNLYDDLSSALTTSPELGNLYKGPQAVCYQPSSGCLTKASIFLSSLLVFVLIFF